MSLGSKGGSSYVDSSGKTHYSDGSTSYTDSGGKTHYSDGSTSYTDSGGKTHYSDGSTSYTDSSGKTHYSDGSTSYTDSGGTTHYSGGGGSSDAGCYLTTACIEARSLPDTCEELTTLRHFRETYMASLPNGKEDINYYYFIAPKIVKAINALDNSKEIYSKIYVQLVEPCVELIKQGKFKEAYSLYKLTTLELERKYLNN